ncbi:restriction endonuclease subunit S [Xanthomonas oryzae pv. oryzae]|uniref:restriction endonuclease subunit S n=1 Tax=Xanthomonas oryzae TaxID=347 RepID=UPI001C6864B5|nr:restriction endonuclease subunit S [Xanthomonas oryzae]
MSELPAGWVEAPLEECVDILDAQRQPINSEERTQRVKGKSTGELLPYYGATGQVGMIDGFLFDEELVALGEDGVPFFEGDKHKAYMLRGKTWVNNHAHVLRSIPEVLDNRILCHFLNQFDYRDYVNGGTRLKLTQANMRRIPLRIPPHAEQKRIAQKLDALLAQVDTLKARIDAIPALLKRFRESALSAAVSGRLTKSHDKTRHLAEPFRLNDGAQPASAEEISQAIEVTGEPFPDQWTIYALEQIVDGERGIPYGIVQTGDPVAEGVSTVRCGDVRHLRIDTTALKVVARDIEKNYARTRLKGGEVLLAIRGSIGNTAVAPKSLANCNISREVAMIPCIEDVDSMFVALVLQSKRGQQLLAGKTRGVAQKGINLADVRRLPIALPSRTTQREIVRRVEQLFAYADQLEAKVTAAQQRIDALTQSLLAKAFRGELVPQDPSDEPASALLERIRAQRAASPKPKRGRKAATS